jgi:hypothetical protein
VPGALDDYVAHFNAADAALRKLLAAVGGAMVKVAPGRRPWLGRSPSPDEVHALWGDFLAKSAPLMAEYNGLPDDIRRHAPKPETAGLRA